MQRQYNGCLLLFVSSALDNWEIVERRKLRLSAAILVKQQEHMTRIAAERRAPACCCLVSSTHRQYDIDMLLYSQMLSCVVVQICLTTCLRSACTLAVEFGIHDRKWSSTSAAVITLSAESSPTDT